MKNRAAYFGVFTALALIFSYSEKRDSQRAAAEGRRIARDRWPGKKLYYGAADIPLAEEESDRREPPAVHSQQ